MTAVELLPPGEAVPENPRWHELRRQGITASEIAAVMGISPWESPFSLYWRKVNGWETESNEYTETGQWLEPRIAGWWFAHHPHTGPSVMTNAGLYAHADRPWQLATPDRLVYERKLCSHGDGHPEWYCDDRGDLSMLLECKWVAYRWDGWGEQGTDDIPVYYRAQCLWQADVMGVDEVHVAALGPGGFRAYRIERDEDDLKLMREAAQEFWWRIRDHLNGTPNPPPLDSHTATLGTLKRLHPTVGEGDVEMPADLVIRFREARATRELANNLTAKTEAEVRALLGDTYNRATYRGRTVASRSVYEQQRIDSARLRIDHPEIVAAYTKTTIVDRLNPGKDQDR